MDYMEDPGIPENDSGPIMGNLARPASSSTASLPKIPERLGTKQRASKDISTSFLSKDP